MKNRVKIFILGFILLIILIFCVICLNCYDKNNSVVVVSVEGYNDNLNVKSGTGFVYKLDNYAYILTNYHVISECDDVYISYNNIKIKANVLNFDDYDDIAILTVDKKYFHNKMKFSDLKEYKNQTVKIITKENDIDVVEGIVDRDIEPVKFRFNNIGKMLDLIKVRSMVNFGYSGSPLVDENNEVIGMITMMDNDNSDYAYAIPASQLIDKVNILEHSYLYRPTLGINVSTSQDEINGVILNEVYDNYPASDASLRDGDIIVSMDNIEITDVLEFRYYLYKYNKNDIIRVKYYRDGKYKEADILLNQ